MPHFNPSGVSDNIVDLCNHVDTIASKLHKKPSSSVHAIWESLYPKPFVLKRLINRFTIKHDLYHGRGDPTKEDLDRAEKCGKFPYRPSDLFLKVRDYSGRICDPSKLFYRPTSPFRSSRTYCYAWNEIHSRTCVLHLSLALPESFLCRLYLCKLLHLLLHLTLNHRSVYKWLVASDVN